MREAMHTAFERARAVTASSKTTMDWAFSPSSEQRSHT